MLFDFIDSGKECPRFVKGNNIALLHFLEHPSIANKYSIFNRNIENNCNNARYSQPQSTGTRGNQYPNPSFDHPAKVATRNTHKVKIQQETPSNHY